MKKVAISILTILVLGIPVRAQNELDALRFSMTDPGSTARFIGLGGAFGALGGDFSTLSLNPAGLGVYRSSEFTITPSMSYQSVQSGYFGTTEEDIKYNFNLNNVGLVFSMPLGRGSDEPGWKYFNLGFGLNRHNNFNTNWRAEGFNNRNSLMTSILEMANRQGSVENLDDFITGLAWDTYLLDMFDGQFFVDMPDGNVLQQVDATISGSTREFVLSAGANYNDVFYVGATVGIPSIRYEEETIYVETDSQDFNDVFNSLTYRNWHETKGSGFNVKVGAIVRLFDILRLGAAVHTPTFYSLEDTYWSSMRSDLNLDYDTRHATSLTGISQYELNTPLKAIGSVGLVLGEFGLLSLDYEYADYTTARLRGDDYPFTDENRAIRNYFNTQHTIRLGGEIRLNPLALRAGYGFYSNPYIDAIDNAQRSVLSAGFGIRDRRYFLDFAYAYSFFSEGYEPYVVEMHGSASPIIARDFSASTYRVTLGWRF
jgi:hypothetical protein